MSRADLPSHVQVVRQGESYLGICLRCGGSLGMQGSLEALKAAEQAHECRPRDKRDQTQKVPKL